MNKQEIEKKELSRIKIDILGNDCVMMQNKYFNFTYFIADKVVKDEYKGKYRYFGGLQSFYEKSSKEYEYLEDRLCEIAEAIFKTINNNQL